MGKRNKSPSSRRAWIEINAIKALYRICDVALLAEGVDRNRFKLLVRHVQAGRPPRGGRG